MSTIEEDAQAIEAISKAFERPVELLSVASFEINELLTRANGVIGGTTGMRHLMIKSNTAKDQMEKTATTIGEIRLMLTEIATAVRRSGL